MNESMQHRTVVLGLGSNVGDRLSLLRRAREALAPYVEIKAASSVYEMAATYANDQPVFLNAAVMGTTRLDPMGLLYTVKDIEIEMGRTPTFHFGPRVIDIDILFFDDLVLHTADLTLPHPLMHERPFVLRPLLDICPDWVHPTLGLSVQALMDALPKGDQITEVAAL